MSAPVVFLIDNGSLRPEASLWLRCLADGLASRTSFNVEPVSLLHSHKVPAEKLDGRAATIVRRRLRECISVGQRNFIFLPLFLGPSLAVSEYLPKLIAEGQEMAPDVSIGVADVLAGPDPDNPDPRLARMLADSIRQLQPERETGVALVDHGTPARPVNRVRNAVARQLKEILGGAVATVQPCSMERREGEAYAFNEPLLESLGEVPSLGGGGLILAMFFLLPGRHAGEGGDVAEICEGLLARDTFNKIESTPLLGEHTGLFDILSDRLRGLS